MRYAASDQADFADRRNWNISITSILAGLWSTIRHHQEMRRIEAAWETIDGRTLQDIGLSHYALERARDPRHWR